MRLADLSDALPAGAARVAGTPGEPEIADVAFDSRLVGPGTLFFCVRGSSADGHDFAAAVVAAGRSRWSSSASSRSMCRSSSSPTRGGRWRRSPPASSATRAPS